MTTYADTGLPTLANVANAYGPDGNIAIVAELLQKQNPILEDMPWMAGNLETGHKVVNRTGLGAPSWRRINEGITPSKTKTAAYTESCGMMEDFCVADKALAKLYGDVNGFRMNEIKGKTQAFGQEVERAFFYESVTSNAERIHGMAPRFPASSGYTTSSYVLPRGTLSGTNCESIWLINWGVDKVTGMYPKNSTAGLTIRDMGEDQLWDDGTGKKFPAYIHHLKWDWGLVVHDYRNVVRLQWDPDDTTNFPDSGKQMVLALQELLDSTYNLEQGNARIYMSRVSARKLDAQVLSNNLNLGEYLQVGNRKLRQFQGVAIRISDALVGESAIS